MTRVDFYHNAGSRLETAARIVRKAYHQGVPALIYAPEPALARELDQLLWVAPSGSFLPHCGADDPLAGETPVVIAQDLASDRAPPNDKLLINLSAEVPPGFARFERIIEVVSTDGEAREQGRARFRHYRDRGYEINTHDVAGASA
ncbi:MAG TPA: DNA polymerase III subunit chi [Rhodocyclaceae bacterium]